MDIIIKSFNRPYYLDRCLWSIYKNVICSEFRIKILDDGTPQKYLDKLIEKYPEIIIYKSEFYQEKVSKIENNFSDFGTKPTSDIPIHLWIEAAQNATDYFLLLEDDIWLTEEIDLKATQKFLQEKKVFFLKLFWLGNQKMVGEQTIESNTFCSIYEPKLFTLNSILFRIIFRTERLKIRKIVSFLGLYSKDKYLHYYSIYSVAGIIFKKDYFLSLWNNHRNSVDEGLQLLNAIKYYNRNKTIKFARSNKEILKTGFLSSATSQHKEYEGIKLDIFTLNKIINEAWYNNDFDPIESYPNDLNPDKIKMILDIQNNNWAKSEEWQKWVTRFKKQFTAFGCKID